MYVRPIPSQRPCTGGHGVGAASERIGCLCARRVSSPCLPNIQAVFSAHFNSMCSHVCCLPCGGLDIGGVRAFDMPSFTWNHQSRRLKVYFALMTI